MRPLPPSVALNMVLSVVVLLSLALTSCIPAPLTPAPVTTAQLPEQVLTLAPSVSAPLAPPETPATIESAAVASTGGAVPSGTAAAGPSQTAYQDPSGRFTVPVPTNWKVAGRERFVVLRDPEDVIKVYVVVVPGDDAENAIGDAWVLADPSFKLAAGEFAVELRPQADGAEKTIFVAFGAPFAGLPFEFRQGSGSGDKPGIVLLSPTGNYTFTRK